MHTRFTLFQRWTDTERRLCFLDKTSREDLLERAEQSGGTMEGATTVNKLESDTRKLRREVENVKAHWYEWILKLSAGSTIREEKTLQLLERRAREIIDVNSDIAIGKLAGIFRRAKRKRYLETLGKITDKLRVDVQNDISSESVAFRERERRFSSVAQALRSTKKPLYFKSEAHRQRSLQALRGVESRLSHNRVVETGSGIWQDALKVEQDIKEQILRYKLVEASDLDQYLQRNAEGDESLQRLLSTYKNLSGATPEEDREFADVRDWIIKSLQYLQNAEIRDYRLERFMQADRNVGTVRERLATLASDRDVSRMTVVFRGGVQEDVYIRNRGNGYLILQRVPTWKGYCILDTKTGEMTYRGKGNLTEETVLDQADSFLVHEQ